MFLFKETTLQRDIDRVSTEQWRPAMRVVLALTRHATTQTDHAFRLLLSQYLASSTKWSGPSAAEHCSALSDLWPQRPPRRGHGEGSRIPTNPQFRPFNVFSSDEINSYMFYTLCEERTIPNLWMGPFGRGHPLEPLVCSVEQFFKTPFQEKNEPPGSSFYPWFNHLQPGPAHWRESVSGG